MRDPGLLRLPHMHDCRQRALRWQSGLSQTAEEGQGPGVRCASNTVGSAPSLACAQGQAAGLRATTLRMPDCVGTGSRLIAMSSPQNVKLFSDGKYLYFGRLGTAAYLVE